MKNFMMLFNFLFVALSSVAQTTVDLPVDESGYITFYDVVDLKDFSENQLLNNAESFLKYYLNKKYKKEISKNPEEGYVEGHSSFLVYKKGSLGKHVDGAIEYNVRIEVKENRYRYIITDFIFQEYERNRYGKFEPVKGSYTPLENSASSLNEWQWDAHKRTVQEKMELLISELKIDMLKSDKSSKKVKKDESW